MKISFFCHIDRAELLNLIDFYNQDIKILKEIDPDMKIATRFNEIDWNADVIYIWWWTYAFYPVIKAKLKNKKVVITGTFNYRCPGVDRDYFKRPLWQQKIIKYATRFADKNIMVSKKEMNEISADWHFNNFIYSPHCVDTAKFCPSKEGIRKDYLFTICGLDSLSVERKCLYELIEAIDIFKKKGEKIKLVIAGRKSNAFDDVKAYIQHHNLCNEIELIGEISEKEKIKRLQECKCYVQPSRYEGFGLAIAEAMSCGCYILSSDVGEVSNVVGDSGVLLKQMDAQSIADGLEQLLMKRGNNESARFQVINKFSIERRRKELHQILNSL